MSRFTARLHKLSVAICTIITERYWYKHIVADPFQSCFAPPSPWRGLIDVRSARILRRFSSVPSETLHFGSLWRNTRGSTRQTGQLNSTPLREPAVETTEDSVFARATANVRTYYWVRPFCSVHRLRVAFNKDVSIRKSTYIVRRFLKRFISYINEYCNIAY